MFRRRCMHKELAGLRSEPIVYIHGHGRGAAACGLRRWSVSGREVEGGQQVIFTAANDGSNLA